MSERLERGSVITVRFGSSVGSEIRKTRPAVVVSNDLACRFDAVVQVVPVTRLPERPLRPFESRVDSAASGLDRASRLVANQVRTVSRRRVGRLLGRVTEEEERALDRALRENVWAGRGRDSEAVLLAGKTALIVGFGAIGRRLAPALRALGLEVAAVRGTAGEPEIVDGTPVHPATALSGLLPTADVIVVALRHQESRHTCTA